MIWTILEVIGAVICAAVAFALVAYIFIRIVSAIAIAEYRRQNGVVYDIDEEEEKK